MTHDKKLDRQSFLSQTAISVSQKIQILFSRDAANVKQANLAVRRTESFKERRIASARMEQFGVEAAWQNFKFRRVKSAFNPTLPVLFGIDENSVELAVKPMHVTPRDAFKKTVLGQDSNVLREIGVINTAGLEIEHFCREQRG